MLGSTQEREPDEARGETMTSRIRRTLGAVALAAGMLAPALAQAAAVRLSDWAYGNSWGNKVTVGAPAHTGAAGGFKGSVDFSAAEEADGWVDIADPDFITYCIEITESFYGFPSALMTGYAVRSAAAYGWSAARTDRIGRLMSHVAADSSRVDTAAESTALQLALWNLVYDTDADLLAGVFKESSTSTFEGYANTLLADSANAANRYEVYVLSKAGSQDFLLLRQVPEPATLALCLAALGGVGLSRLRRRAGAGTAVAPR
jgi:hypothetical protein